jgi:hypothetical protein
MSFKTGKFQLRLAQNRGARQKTAGANSKLDKTWGQGANVTTRAHRAAGGLDAVWLSLEPQVLFTPRLKAIKER